jgi:hypothetical protein
VIPYAAAILLCGSGSAKLLRPDVLAQALRTSRLPSRVEVVRLLAVAELASGASMLLLGGPAVWLVAGNYLAFFAFILQARIRRLPLRSCGCFGQPDTPVTRLHSVVTGITGFLLLVAAVRLEPPPIGPLVSNAPLPGAAFSLLSLALAVLMYALLDALPRLVTTQRSGGRSETIHRTPDVEGRLL